MVLQVDEFVEYRQLQEKKLRVQLMKRKQELTLIILIVNQLYMHQMGKFGLRFLSLQIIVKQIILVLMTRGRLQEILIE